MSGECRIERYLGRDLLPGFFRQLADALESGDGGREFEGLAEFRKVKISVAEQFGQLRLKMRIKGSRPQLPDMAAASGREAPFRYKDLKKRMKHAFKVILRTLHEGQTPPAEAVESFLADAALMTAFPDKGEAFYEEFTNVCEEFADAWRAGNLARMGAMAEEIAHQKARCHALHR